MQKTNIIAINSLDEAIKSFYFSFGFNIVCQCILYDIIQCGLIIGVIVPFEEKISGCLMNFEFC